MDIQKDEQTIGKTDGQRRQDRPYFIRTFLTMSGGPTRETTNKV